MDDAAFKRAVWNAVKDDPETAAFLRDFGAMFGPLKVSNWTVDGEAIHEPEQVDPQNAKR